MTNASVKDMFAVLLVSAVTVFSGAFATIANAQEYDSGWGSGGDVSYDSGWGTGSYNNTYDSGWGTGNSSGYGFSPDTSGYGFSPDATGYGFSPDVSGYGFSPDVSGYGFSPDASGYVVEDGVIYTYTADAGYSTGYGGYSLGSYASFAPTSYSFRAPSTSYAASYPVTYSQPQTTVRPTTTTQPTTVTQPINIVNTNTNNNNNVNNNVNTVSVTPVQQTPITYPVQYVYQQPTYVPSYNYPTYNYPTYPTYNYPTYNNTYCTITASPSSISNGQAAYLTWSSSGATSAWLSDGIGMVAVNGSLAVRPNGSRVYTLTVSGYGGTNTCSATVNVQGSYVSLSQIPYTGFDAGPFGNALYWLSLLSFAAAGAYLVVYFKGGALALAHSMFSGQAGSMLGSRENVRVSAPAPVETQVETVEAPVETMTPSPIDVMEFLPVAQTVKATMDSMQVIHSKEGQAPRIVITRN